MGFTERYKVFGFGCCGECSTKTRASDLGQGLFCCVCHCLTSEQDGTGLEQQRSRPPPAAETGRRGWGRVLIFQGPAKGLRKNQQTQLVKAAHLSYSFRRNVYQESSACRSTICTASVGRDRTRTGRLCAFQPANFTLSGVFFPWQV